MITKFDKTNPFKNILKRVDNTPVIETENLLDFSQADKYQNQFSYVWFKNKNEDIRPDFDWSWRPDSTEIRSIYNFVSYVGESTTVRSYNVLKLVPTNPKYRTGKEITSLVPASYSPVNTTLYIAAFNGQYNKARVDRLKKSHTLVRVVDGFDSIMDIIFELNPSIMTEHNFIISPDVSGISSIKAPKHSEDGICLCSVVRSSTDDSMPSNHVVYFNREYVERVLSTGENVRVIVENNDSCAKLDDLKNPYIAWESGFVNRVLNARMITYDNKFEHVLDHGTGRMIQFMKQGEHAANELLHDTEIEECVKLTLNKTWLRNRFMNR